MRETLAMTTSPRSTPFETVLVANRGEIALRVMRSARALGLRTVAVYSDADAGAPHVLAADRAVHVGGAAPAQSYLDIAALVAAARASGADAVHPGYGFLAENAAFAAACAEAGLVFVGPSPQAIRAMGDKAGAKRLMRAADVPCIPGFDSSDPADQAPARLAQEAQRVGWPLMIKASAGGGGRGMRRVERAEDFAEALRSAQAEALGAFGDATVILERAVDGARHVEIQVFADRHGQVLHLGERDCSVQRRHQKLVEEAPSPAVDAALRERMGAAAVAAARAIGYEGAGTLEFLLDADGRFYFMEMNTRLQVEHPVTEALTGLDLVEWQLRVAAGEALPLAQPQVAWRGHAIEVRLCAEDPLQGFLPQSGTLRRWQPAPGVRIEHALADGASVPPHYDPMIAKIVAHGATREEARRRLRHALQDTLVLGLATNQDFLARCLAHPVFVAGQATTGFVGQHLDSLLAEDAPARARVEVLAAGLLHATEGRGTDRLALDEAVRDATLAPVHALPLLLRYAVDGRECGARIVRADASRFEVETASARRSLEITGLHASRARVTLDGVQERVDFHREGAVLWLHHAGRAWRVEDFTRAPARRAGVGGHDGRVRASTTGRVAAVRAGVGTRVEAGSLLVVLEAMKMEHLHLAPVSGTVVAVHVEVDVQVAVGRVLVEVVADEAAETASR